jgi:hypothetical protein
MLTAAARPDTTRTGTARVALIAAPLLLIAYGIARALDGLDGSHGPGPAWTIGHLFFLAGILLFGVVLFDLRAALPRWRGFGTAALAVGLVGILAFVRTILVDLIVGFRSTDRPAMNALYPHYDSWPGGLPSGLTGFLDNAGPSLFVVAMLVLTVLLATLRPRRLPWWSPVLVAIGFLAISFDLDLLTVGGFLVLLSLLPAARRSH